MALELQLILIPLIIMYAHMTEWVLHRYVLHGLGKKKTSMFAYHWHAHHRTVRKNAFHDPAYATPLKGDSRREIVSLLVVYGAHFPVVYASVLWYVVLGLCTIRYYYLHRKMHLNPGWGKARFPCHWDHHMGKKQNANWTVTCEWPDRLLGTRITSPKK